MREACLKQERHRTVWVAKSKTLVKEHETCIERDTCMLWETCVKQDEIDKESLTSPDATELIWNAGMTCVRESEIIGIGRRETSCCRDVNTMPWMRRLETSVHGFRVL